jgi:uncharacterized membrane protein YhaH (DUF805 family)
MPAELGIIKEMLPLLIPLMIIQLALLIIAIVDLVKREHVTGDNKIVWALVIIFINMIGPIIYLLVGRKEKTDDSY